VIDAIVSDPKVRNGRPVLKGTGFRVIDVVLNHRDNGMTPEQIAERFRLDLGHVYAAFAYYYMHKDEVDADIEQYLEDGARAIEALERQGKLTRLE
jgi:uncharacterized protein (DUF433 family)